MKKKGHSFFLTKPSIIHFSDLEHHLKERGYSLIAGVDEAGRGAIAGPVFASAVILPEGFDPKEIKDSKKLNPKKREELFDYICSNALTYAIAKVDVDEINAQGILKATFKAMYEALKRLNPQPQVVLVDGPLLIPEFRGVQKAVVEGDNLCVCIAAASILAKVARDNYMKELAKVYPQYGFEKHKGYGTKLHFSKIKIYGPCEVHRTYYQCFL